MQPIVETTVGGAVWLLLARAILVPVALAGVSVGPSETVPLATGLVFTTTSHAGLATTAGSAPVADTEAVYSVIGGDEDRVLFRFTVSAPPDTTAGKLLDGVPHSLDRTVRREDLRSALRLTIFWNSTDPALLPGQTFATTSSAALQALHDAGKVAFVLGVNEPDEGLAGLANLASGTRPSADRSSSQAFVASGVAAMLSLLGVSRHYYRGTLERVGAGDEPFAVLLDGRRTTVPAVHVRGTLKFNDRTIAPELWWLDAADSPLTLRWAVAGLYETVTRIDRPMDVPARSGTAAVAEALSGKSCRAELSGVYFTTASAEVLDASMPALERFAALMNQHSDWRVTIEGHTDDVGQAAYNMDLSTRRAGAVRDALTRQFGVPAARLQSQGYGLTRPVETNATDEGRAHNRRVEVSRQCIGGF